MDNSVKDFYEALEKEAKLCEEDPKRLKRYVRRTNKTEHDLAPKRKVTKK